MLSQKEGEEMPISVTSYLFALSIFSRTLVEEKAENELAQEGGSEPSFFWSCIGHMGHHAAMSPNWRSGWFWVDVEQQQSMGRWGRCRTGEVCWRWLGAKWLLSDWLSMSKCRGEAGLLHSHQHCRPDPCQTLGAPSCLFPCGHPKVPHLLSSEQETSCDRNLTGLAGLRKKWPGSFFSKTVPNGSFSLPFCGLLCSSWPEPQSLHHSH